ncbi:MAG: glycosyltransferase family 1 protein [Acidobacteriota bacterium]
MNVIFDHQIFSMQKHGGISGYFFNLYKNLVDLKNIKAEILIKYSDNSYIQKDHFHNIPQLFQGEFRGKYRIQNFINRKVSEKILKRNIFDIFHPTYFDPYFLNFLKEKPFVLTVFDMIFEKHLLKTDQNKLISNKKVLAERSAKIIAISENTRKDIIEILGIESNKIEVIGLAGDHILAEKDISSPVLNERYILYVGNRKGYKNFTLFLESVAPVLKEKKDLYLVCAGGGEFTEEEKLLFINEGVNSKVHFFEVDNISLSNLYKNAELFIFPSVYEGFGIPVLEAFLLNCPVLLSDTEVFREIAGDAALFFDPVNKTSIRNTITEALENKGLTDDLKEKGLERGKSFSWEKTAKQTFDLYQKLI